jgi:hypothetical protein
MGLIPTTDFAMLPHDVVLVCTGNQVAGCRNSPASSMLSPGKSVLVLDKTVERDKAGWTIWIGQTCGSQE